METEFSFVSVILPAHNEEEHLSDCLASLLDQDYPTSKYEIILVDNGSTDRTAEIAKSFGIHIIQQQDGPVGRVRNAGAEIAKGDLLLFLDSDCVAPKNWVSYAASQISPSSNLVLGGGCELRASPTMIEKYWILDGQDGAVLPKDLIGACIAISSKTFWSVNGFDEHITSGEDSALSEALRKKGYDVSIDRGMSVVHLGNPTDVRTFFLRQIWHSENYVKKIRKSIRDPTFILVSLFLGIVVSSMLMAFYDLSSAILLALLGLTLPTIFSAKRIHRSKRLSHLKNIHKIYLLDLTYVIGRSLGLIKGICRLLNKPS